MKFILVAITGAIASATIPPPSPFNYGFSSSSDQNHIKQLEIHADSKFGMFMHNGPVTQWGVEIGWPLVCISFPCDVVRPNNTTKTLTNSQELAQHRQEYNDLAKTYNPVNFNATDIARRAKAAGMKYFVYTTVHCDGFLNWDSAISDYNIMNTPYGKDLFGEVVDAMKAEDIKVGAYFCTTRWGPDDSDFVYPDAMASLNSNGGEMPNYDIPTNQNLWDGYVQRFHDLIGEVAVKYQPDIFWFDCHNAPPYDTRIDDMYAAIRAENVDALVLVRGGVFSDWTELPDQSEETVKNMMPFERAAKSSPFEVCATIQENSQWTYSPFSGQKKTKKLLANLMMINAKGGNYLLNVGPMSTGEFAPEANERLDEMAEWMRVNGEAMGGTEPLFPYQSSSPVGKAGAQAYFMVRDEGAGGLSVYVMVPAEIPGDGTADENLEFDNEFVLESFRPQLMGKGVVLDDVELLGGSGEEGGVKFIIDNAHGISIKVLESAIEGGEKSLSNGMVFKLSFKQNGMEL
ncbi:hypothetical protein ScalyP_jg8552 [Parmales sp. scaly parma]|mgnify:CR=1 FL=1|nr:hypothetical protein ScalyP_jg8552 [Parmales sp. scaly parma]